MMLQLFCRRNRGPWNLCNLPKVAQLKIANKGMSANSLTWYPPASQDVLVPLQRWQLLDTNYPASNLSE